MQALCFAFRFADELAPRRVLEPRVVVIEGGQCARNRRDRRGQIMSDRVQQSRSKPIRRLLDAELRETMAR